MRRRPGSLLAPKRSVSEALERAAETSERSDRIVSLKRFAELTGRDRDTIAKWVDPSRKNPCPVVSRGGPGEPILVDIKAVLAWREECVRIEERKKYAAPDAEPGTEHMSPADLSKLEDIKLKRQTLAMKAKILIHREPQQSAVRQALGLVRQTVMSVPEQVTRKLVGAVSSEKIEEIHREVWGLCASALTSAATEINAAMRVAADRVIEFDDEEDDADGE